jgi:hypothetical protein
MSLKRTAAIRVPITAASVNFKATMQSTLITFKGDHETARSVGDTNPDSIGALLEKAI